MYVAFNYDGTVVQSLVTDKVMSGKTEEEKEASAIAVAMKVIAAREPIDKVPKGLGWRGASNYRAMREFMEEPDPGYDLRPLVAEQKRQEAARNRKPLMRRLMDLVR